MKKLATYVMCICIAILPSCSMMTQEQRDNAREVITQAYDEGRITAEEYARAIEMLDNQIDWNQILLTGSGVLISLITGIPLAVNRVNKMRGPITKPPVI